MKNPKLMKAIVKGALGFLVSAGVGYAIKAEKKLAVQIDEYFKVPE